MKASITISVCLLFICLGLNSQVQQYGLVAYYPFSGNANDESGNGHNGTVNGAVLATDRFGKENSVYYFDGASNISISPNTAFYNNNYTYSMWYKPTQLPSFDECFYMLSIGGFGGDQILGLVNKFAGLGTGFQSGGYNRPSGTTVQAATTFLPEKDLWYHIVSVRTDDSVKLYIDGTLIGKNTTNNLLPKYSDNGTAIKIGSRFNDITYSPGYIDDVKIYNRALNETEVHLLYYEGLTGIQKCNNLAEISVYPNPSKDYLWIDCKDFGKMSNYKIKLLNTSATVLWETTVSQEKYYINLSGYSKGLYLLEIFDVNNSRIETKKIVLQ